MKNFLFAVLVGGAVWLLFSLGKSVPVDVPETQTSEVTAMPLAEKEKIENVSIETKMVSEDRLYKNVPIGTKVDNDTVLVVRVVDGDTIEIEWPFGDAEGKWEKVRYIGVNTPESVDPRRKVQCFGKEASAYNKKLVEGKRVRLEHDVEDRDKYHRLLRYVWLDDTMVNEQLVVDGYAQIMTIPPNVQYADRFRAAQTQAREAKRGLWDKCKKK